MGQLGDKIISFFSSFIGVFNFLVGGGYIMLINVLNLLVDTGCSIINLLWACRRFFYIYDIVCICIFDLLASIEVFYLFYL